MSGDHDNGSLRISVDGAVATAVISRPTARNAIDQDVLDGLEALADMLEAGFDVRAAVIVGEGEHFSAGADISAAHAVTDEAAARRFIGGFRASLQRLSDVPQPVLCAIEGWALGGGLELALWSDLRVVSEGARLGVPEVKIGALPGAGGTQLLPRLVGWSMAKQLCLTGEPVSGRRAYEIGLANELTQDGEAFERARELATRMSRLAPLAIGAMKEGIARGADLPLGEALELERRLGAELFATEDRAEGMRAFLAKRRPMFVGQ